MNVLSLFDGLSCGQIALTKNNININNYYASEIDKYAIQVVKYNYPNTIHIGTVENWKQWDIDWSKIDLLIGGSPCQGFSSSGKGLNFDDPRSKLFFTYADILNHIKKHNPNVKFMLENVKMKKEWCDVITEYLGVNYVEINSKYFSAQNRVRYYWCNFEILPYEDRNIKLNDILEYNDGMVYPASIIGRRLNSDGKRDDYNKSIPLIQYIEVRETNLDKSYCLTTVAKDNVLTNLTVGRYPDAFGSGLPFRYYTIKEYCRLQTIPDDYFGGIVSDNQIRKMIGNAWTVDVVAHIFKSLK